MSSTLHVIYIAIIHKEPCNISHNKSDSLYLARLLGLLKVDPTAGGVTGLPLLPCEGGQVQVSPRHKNIIYGLSCQCDRGRVEADLT